MRRIVATATVTTDGRLTVQVPPEVHPSPGQHEVVVEIRDQRDSPHGTGKPPDLPVIHVAAWPQGLSLRREDLYGDDGR